MVQRDREVRNAARREYVAQQGKKSKAKSKLSRRMALKKAEKEDSTGELKRQRLAQNIPRTIENTKEWVGGIEPAEEVDERDSNDYERNDGDDPRTRPVRVKSGGGDDGEDVVLDMAGLEDLFPEQDQPEASTSELQSSQKPILLTTSPRPHGPTYAFLKEFQSLLGGNKYAHIVPRKNARFDLSKICRWAAKRGYGAILVFGEDLHGSPGKTLVSGKNHRQANFGLFSHSYSVTITTWTLCSFSSDLSPAPSCHISKLYRDSLLCINTYYSI